MNINKNIRTTVDMSIIITEDDIKDIIRSKFNLDSGCSIIVTKDLVSPKNMAMVIWQEYHNGN